jgi:anti-sigma factor RsiW
LRSSECPVDLEKVAEAYVMGTLPEEQATAFESHYAARDTCATALYKTADYVDAVRRRRGRRATDSYHGKDFPIW